MAKQKDEYWAYTSTGDLTAELMQLEDEGRDLSEFRKKAEAFIALGPDEHIKPERQAEGALLLDEAQTLPMRKDYTYNEPSDLAAIRKLRARGPRKYKKNLPDKVLRDRLTGAWLGRCIGCLLGKPVEGVKSADLWGFLKLTRQYPLKHYIRFRTTGKAKKEYPKLAERSAWYDNLNHMPIDDDTNYTLTGHLIVKKHGPNFTPANVGSFWLGSIPFLATCTAERMAYRNMTQNIMPPASATFRNTGREWIGAQIRADAFGYVNAGNPQRAAEFAWRDACISHVKNGIYGEMLMAAMIAAAPYATDVLDLLKVGLSEIPRTSRLHADVSEAMGWHRQGLSYDDAVARIHQRWDENTGHHWVHTNSNAVICTVGLLWGEGDFGTAICRAVQPCFDTDCNGATVGSIMGMMLGTAGIGSEWTDKVNNTLKTSLIGYDTVKISDVAEETFKLMKEIR